ELISVSNCVLGVPMTLESLVDSIDDESMPELLLFKPVKRINIVSMESYLCPIPFPLFENLNNSQTKYDEYRTIEEMKDGADFTRWLSFIYINHADAANR